MTAATTQKREADLKTREGLFWQGIREIGFGKILTFIISVVLLSSSTSWGVAVFVTDLANERDVTQNTDSIRANTAANLQQALALEGITARVAQVQSNYCEVLVGQDNIQVQMERLLCRLDGATANTCDLRHRLASRPCGNGA